jgi:large subunit ribosomal protein L14e
MQLTKIVLKIQRNSRNATVKDAFTKAGAAEAFAKSSWGKKLAVRAARQNATDFERFALLKAKASRAFAARTDYLKAKKAFTPTAKVATKVAKK